jgi:hypothetical protein
MGFEFSDCPSRLQITGFPIRPELSSGPKGSELVYRSAAQRWFPGPVPFSGLELQISFPAGG